MRHLVLYEYVKDVVERRGPYREEHLSKIRAGRESGKIVMAGPLGDERPTGAAIVFADDAARAEVEAFVNDDPYVKAGLVASWRIEPWKLV